jgi:hypothetical protein
MTVADTSGVDDFTWTFSRAEQTLEIRRTPVADGHRLAITGDGSPRSFFFGDMAALVAFQSDMEAFLLKTGWSFLKFSPERRTGVDRRGWPRLTERRRWWTDGQGQPPEQASRTNRGGRRRS